MSKAFCRSHSLFVLNLGSWTQTEDVHGLGGVPHQFNTLNECKEACINDIGCVAIDWEPSNVGYECWTVTTSATSPTDKPGFPGYVTHYALNRELSVSRHFYCIHHTLRRGCHWSAFTHINQWLKWFCEAKTTLSTAQNLHCLLIFRIIYFSSVLSRVYFSLSWVALQMLRRLKLQYFGGIVICLKVMYYCDTLYTLYRNPDNQRICMSWCCRGCESCYGNRSINILDNRKANELIQILRGCILTSNWSKISLRLLSNFGNMMKFRRN